MYPIKHFKTLSAATAGDVDVSVETQEIFLHRQGTSSTFYGGISNGKLRVAIELVELTEGVSICCDLYDVEEMVTVSGQSKHFASGELPKWLLAHRHPNPILATEFFIREKLGVKAKISSARLAYMYDGQEREDLIFSPMVYEPSTDSIRSAVENYCVVHFADGSFDNRNLDVDRAAGIYRAYLEEALQKGFHACDRKRGDEYCKRRLAWLAGEYAKEDFLKIKKEVKVGILNSLMEWPRSREALRKVA